jgi:hypothetical protein
MGILMGNPGGSTENGHRHFHFFPSRQGIERTDSVVYHPFNRDAKRSALRFASWLNKKPLATRKGCQGHLFTSPTVFLSTTNVHF